MRGGERERERETKSMTENMTKNVKVNPQNFRDLLMQILKIINKLGRKSCYSSTSRAKNKSSNT